jgi:hypothetical protein
MVMRRKIYMEAAPNGATSAVNTPQGQTLIDMVVAFGPDKIVFDLKTVATTRKKLQSHLAAYA